jgi:hypothetical protein
MSNIRFDRLVAKQNLKAAKEALASWAQALVRTDLNQAEIDFLARSFRSAKEQISYAQAVVDGGWGW